MLTDTLTKNPFELTVRSRAIWTIAEEHGLTEAAILAYKHIGRVGDFGCGGAHAVMQMVEQGVCAVGIDLYLDKWKLERYPQHLLTADFSHIPLSDHYFRLGLSHFAFGYYAETSADFEAHAQEISRVMDHGGLLYHIIELKHKAPLQRQSIWNYITQPASGIRLYRPSKINEPYTFETNYVYDGYGTLMQQTGFRIIGIYIPRKYTVRGHCQLLSVCLEKV